ncbi:MAG: hypothetical protein U0414_25465 [Polyangiaceae bacterium]
MALCRTRSKAAMLALALGVLAGCSGTGGGDTGDPRTTPNPNEYGTGLRVTDLVGPAVWLSPGNMMSAGCAVPADRSAYMTGQVIVGVDKYDETGAGQTGNIYVEDFPTTEAPKPYSGITIFAPSFSPPDLRLFEGDLVDSFGTFSEFIGPSSGPFGDCKTLPEFNGTLTFRFEDATPEPLTIVKDGASNERFAPIKGYENARQWLGMLVRIEGVTLTKGPVCSGGSPSCPSKDCTQCPEGWLGRYSADIDVGGGVAVGDIVGISNELMDVKTEMPAIAAGTKFKAVTGIFTYFYGFKIAPRSVADFEL